MKIKICKRVISELLTAESTCDFARIITEFANLLSWSCYVEFLDVHLERVEVGSWNWASLNSGSDEGANWKFEGRNCVT